MSVAAAARVLGISVRTAREHVRRLAVQLPNPHRQPAQRLVLSSLDPGEFREVTSSSVRT
jgi:hypothetical protein